MARHPIELTLCLKLTNRTIIVLALGSLRFLTVVSTLTRASRFVRGTCSRRRCLLYKFRKTTTNFLFDRHRLFPVCSEIYDYKL